jgi:hypothetical protein
MKALLSFVLLLFIIVGCKKNRNYGSCRMTQLQNFDNGIMVSAVTYEYDVQGRIKKINQANSYINTYDYFADSVVLIGTSQQRGSSRTTYFLNSSGQAISAKTSLNPNPYGLQFDNLYTYNSDGYLIAEREIFSQVYNGNILRDTFYTNYTIVNGNVTKATRTNSPDFTYQYTGNILPDNIPGLNPFPSREGSFKGKHPNNLVSNVISGGNTDNYSYSFDRRGNVSELKVSSAGLPSTIRKTVFHYDCN